MTWNVLIGCTFGCTYCSVRRLVRTRLKNAPRYSEGMKPRLVPELLQRRFKDGDFCFVGYMGDIACQAKHHVELVLEVVSAFPGTKFLFCSKDPAAYQRWGFQYPPNLYLGTTIESNLNHGLSRAPAPAERYRAMVELQHGHKFVSIEPLLDFHLATLVGWIKEIGPEIVEVGPDNYHNNLPEPVTLQGQPGRGKVRKLLEMLREFCPSVVEKKGLDRLL